MIEQTSMVSLVAKADNLYKVLSQNDIDPSTVAIIAEADEFPDDSVTAMVVFGIRVVRR